MNLQTVEKQFSDYFLNIDVRGEERETRALLRERWDENTLLHEAISSEEAYEILDLLLCDTEAAKKRLERALDDAFDQYLLDCEDSNVDAYIDAMEDCF